MLVIGSGALFVLKSLSEFLTRQDDPSASGAHSAGMDALRALEKEGPRADLMSLGKNLSERYLAALRSEDASGRKSVKKERAGF